MLGTDLPVLEVVVLPAVGWLALFAVVLGLTPWADASGARAKPAKAAASIAARLKPNAFEKPPVLPIVLTKPSSRKFCWRLP